MRWRLRRPSAVILTRTTRRSSSSVSLATRPALSSEATNRVTVGGWTCSAVANSPRVGLASRLTVPSAEA